MELGKLWEPESCRGACGGAGAMVAKSAIMTFREIISSIHCTLKKGSMAFGCR